jgi:hypothetical protein
MSIAATSANLTSPDIEWDRPGTALHPDDVRLAHDLEPLVERIRELYGLGPNWDSYGGRRVHAGAVRAVLELLSQVRGHLPLPIVSPMSTGGLQLEWGGNDEGVEIEVGPDGTVTVLIDVEGAATERRATGLGDPLVFDALAWAAKLA